METTNKMKRQSTKWEKTFANEVNKNGLISKIFKQFMQLNIEKQPNQKMGRSKQTFLKTKTKTHRWKKST